MRLRPLADPQMPMPRLPTSARPRCFRHHLLAHPVLASPGKGPATPPFHLHTHAAPICYLPMHPFSATRGGAHATLPLHPNTHVIPSLLKAHPFWCTSRSGVSPEGGLLPRPPSTSAPTSTHISTNGRPSTAARLGSWQLQKATSRLLSPAHLRQSKPLPTIDLPPPLASARGLFAGPCRAPATPAHTQPIPKHPHFFSTPSFVIILSLPIYNTLHSFTCIDPGATTASRPVS